MITHTDFLIMRLVDDVRVLRLVLILQLIVIQVGILENGMQSLMKKIKKS